MLLILPPGRACPWVRRDLVGEGCRNRMCETRCFRVVENRPLASHRTLTSPNPSKPESSSCERAGAAAVGVSTRANIGDIPGLFVESGRPRKERFAGVPGRVSWYG